MTSSDEALNIVKRGRVWYFQIRTPASLREIYGTHIRKSLKTRDKAEAVMLARPLTAQWEQAFARARANPGITPEEIEALARQPEYQDLVMPEGFDIDAAIETFTQHVNWLLTHPDIEHKDGTLETSEPPIVPDQEEQGIVLDETARHTIVQAVLRNMIAQKLLPDTTPAPRYPPPPILSSFDDDSITLQEAVERYIEAHEGDWAVKTFRITSRRLGLLCDHLGHDRPIAAISRLDVTNWRERISQLDPKWAKTRRTDTMTLERIEQEFGDHPTGLSDWTVRGYTSVAHAFFDWLSDEGYLGEQRNPSKLTKVKQEKGRETLPDSVVTKILSSLNPEPSPEKHDAASAMSWVVHIAAYSGARLEEICSLKTEDIRFEDSVHYLNIKDSKTPSGIRQVPIHSYLLRRGLLDYVKSCKAAGDYLFPSLKLDKNGFRSSYMSEKISKHLLKIGLSRTEYPKLGAHYFRGSVITKFDNMTEVQDKDWKRIVGHSTGNDVSIKSYSGGLTMQNLQEIVEKISY